MRSVSLWKWLVLREYEDLFFSLLCFPSPLLWLVLPCLILTTNDASQRMCIFLKAFDCDAWQVAVFGISPIIRSAMTIAIIYFSANECNSFFVTPYPKYKYLK